MYIFCQSAFMIDEHKRYYQKAAPATPSRKSAPVAIMVLVRHVTLRIARAKTSLSSERVHHCL